MIIVKVYWNTAADGTPVPPIGSPEDPKEDGPVSYYGPFNDISDAENWIENEYPEDDMDVRDMIADDFDIPDDSFINTPESIHGDIPDEDIRDDEAE